ncbi:MAG: hypothetical protein LBP64_05540 [Tannerella sp.]|jgi:uncharacterized membrane protein|nr:hypothetical protein [Tannerella sp.]
MTKNESWSKATTAIFNGILLYSIAGVLKSIVDPIESLMSIVGSVSGGNDVADGLTAFTYLLSAGIIGGYVLYLLGLNSFGEILEANDSASVGKIRTGVILGLVGIVLGLLPLAGWILGGIANIIAFIMMMTGYSALKNSQTFPARARRGAGTLYTSQILLIIGVVLGWIPVLGGVFEGILGLIAFILVLSGWSTIKNTQPEAPTYSMPGAPQQ